jgi:hypothetical protein
MFFVKFFLIAFGLESLRMVDRGDWRGAVFFIITVLLWFWRPILDWFLDERWRENWRHW